MKQTAIDTVGRYIASHHLLRQGGRCLVALSGGADSVALLLILRQLGYPAEAIHCNFRLRGDESDRDEQFCVELCDRLGVKLHCVHFDTRFYAAQHHVSIEMAARELRYGYFARLADAIGAEAVCVAHHQDDSIETVVMNLIRGTGLQGLVGIRPVNGIIVRPLLCLTRADIEHYLESTNQPYMTDSTNLEDEAVRNRIRHHLLPLMEQINPAARQNIARTASILAQVADGYYGLIGDDARQLTVSRRSADGMVGYMAVDIARLMASRLPHDTLLYILRDYGFRPQQVDAIWQNLDAPTGKTFLSESHELVFDRGELLIAQRDSQPIAEHTFPIEGSYHIDNGRVVDISICAAATTAVSRDPFTATLDADKLQLPLRLRGARQADRFHPFGMRGAKLVSDYLTDCHVPLFLKRRQLVVEDATGRVVWLVGQRTDDRFRVGPSTQRIMRIRYGEDAI